MFPHRIQIHSGGPEDGTVLSRGKKGQKILHCPGTKGQGDKLKILPWAGPGQDFDISPRDMPGWDRILKFCHRTGQDWILTVCPGRRHGTERKKEKKK